MRNQAAYQWCQEDEFIYYSRKRARRRTGIPISPALMNWAGRSNLNIIWGNDLGREEYIMLQYRLPIRKNTPQVMTYTFRDQANVAVNLAGYSKINLLIKLQNILYATIPAEFLNSATGRVTNSHSYTFTKEGIWHAQFVCTDDEGFKLYGEPIQLQVVKNVDDLTLDELLVK